MRTRDNANVSSSRVEPMSGVQLKSLFVFLCSTTVAQRLTAMKMHLRIAALLNALLLIPAPLFGQEADSLREGTPDCTWCEQWNQPHPPVRIYGNAYYVGTSGLSSILITSSEGHVLIDGALPESVPHILSSLAAVGVRPEDIRLILNSHAHFDHAGGIAELQERTGATVAASPASAAVLRRGSSGPDDPQFRELLPFPAVAKVQEIADGDTLQVGSVVLTALFTPGHTAGGTTWTWMSCEEDTCLDMVYADSMTPVSEDGYLFSRSDRYPAILDDFGRSFDVLEHVSCDILLAPHPAASNLWERIEAREQGAQDALVNPDACRDYATTARQRLADRLASEQRDSE